MKQTEQSSAEMGKYLKSIRNGTLILQGKLGGGGMGHVYKAYDTELQRVVAVKLLFPDDEGEGAQIYFKREVRAISRIWHPNIIQILDHGEEPDGTYYLVMEYVPGKNLADVIENHFPLPVKRILHILMQLLSALEEAHRHKIIHRDLKPENIMLQNLPGTPDFVKVLDFGIAKILDHNQIVGPITQRGLLMGTPHFMSPEQILGQDIDARSDIYSVGALLYQMLTAHLPFEGEQTMHILSRVLSEEPIPPSQRAPHVEIHPALEAICLKALRKKRDARFQDAQSFQQALQNLWKNLELEESAEHQAKSPFQTQNIPPLKGTLLALDHAPAIQKEKIRRLAVMVVLVNPKGQSVKANQDWVQGLEEIEAVLRDYGAATLRIKPNRITAFWGYPDFLESAADRALEGSRQILQKVQRDMEDLQIQIGLSYGDIAFPSDHLADAHGVAREHALVMAYMAKPNGILVDDALAQIADRVRLERTEEKGRYRPIFEEDEPEKDTEELPVVEQMVHASLSIESHEALWQPIKEFLHDALKGEAKRLFLLGQEGSGKTHFLQRIRNFATDHHMNVIFLQGTPFWMAQPGRVLRQILEQVFSWMPKRDPMEAIKSFRFAAGREWVLKRLWKGQGPLGDPKEWEESLVIALASLLRSLSVQQPILLISDQIETIDELSLSVLKALSPRLSSSSIAFIFGLRQGDRYTQKLVQGERVLVLDPLSDEYVLQKLDHAISEWSEVHKDLLVQHIQGRLDYLLYVQEAIENLDEDTTERENFIEYVLSLKFQNLSESSRRLVAYAASLGPVFPKSLLEESLPEHWNIQEDLTSIIDRGILKLFEENGEIWVSFTPMALAHHATQILPRMVKRQLHLLAVYNYEQHYESQQSTEGFEDYDDLFHWAKHLLDAGHLKDALKLFAYVLDRLQEKFGPKAASLVRTTMLDAIHHGRMKADSVIYQQLILKAARNVLTSGYANEALALLAQLEDAPNRSPLIRAEQNLIQAMAMLEESPELAFPLLEYSLLEFAKDEVAIQSHILLTWSQILLDQKDFQGALEKSQALESKIQGLLNANLPYQHKVLLWKPWKIQGQALIGLQHFDKAIAVFEKGIRVCKEAHCIFGLAELSLNWIQAWKLKDDHRDLRFFEIFKHARDACMLSGHFRGLAHWYRENGHQWLLAKNPTKAEKNFQKALGLAYDLGWNQTIAEIHETIQKIAQA